MGVQKNKVKIGHAVSTNNFVFSGFLQGSVMRPNIFLLFIKDLPETLTNNIKIFADDVNLKSL